jgi:metallophosphoesterase (TIGR00282 family)
MVVLFIGDIVGKPGRKIVKDLLPGLSAKHKPDITIANGENLAGGFGITEKVAANLFESGVDLITTGNHVWDRKEGVPYVTKEYRVLRPANYPLGAPGNGSIVYTVRDVIKVAVLNLSGRVFMNDIDCPFSVADKEVERLSGMTGIIIVDFHAEATSEKIAFGYFLDGRVSAVLGTHTHVQTADERVLQGGTAYISDVGMTGPLESVIGLEKEQIIQRFVTGMPQKYEVAKGPTVLCAVVVEIDDNTGMSKSIERIMIQQE